MEAIKSIEGGRLPIKDPSLYPLDLCLDRTGFSQQPSCGHIFSYLASSTRMEEDLSDVVLLNKNSPSLSLVSKQNIVDSSAFF